MENSDPFRVRVVRWPVVAVLEAVLVAVLGRPCGGFFLAVPSPCRKALCRDAKNHPRVGSLVGR